MPRRRTRGRNWSQVKNLRRAKNITKNVDVDDMHCEIVFEGTQSMSSSPAKPLVMKQTPEPCGDKTIPSKVNCTSTGAADQIKENVSRHSPQVTIDSQGCIIVDESSLVVENSVEPEVDVVYENTKKHKNRQWTLEDTKKFYASLGTVQTDFSMMSHLFNNSRSRHELKLKFKLEEKRNRDLIDKALRPACNINTVLSDKSVSDLSANQNSNAEKLRKRTSKKNEATVQNTSSAEVYKPKKRHRRVRKFYFSTNSEDDDVEVINKEGDKASYKRSRKLTHSSQPTLPDSAEVVPLETRNDAFQSAKQNTTSKCAAYALDSIFTSSNGFNIHRPAVVRIGESGRRQTVDARVILNVEDDVIPLVNTEDTHHTRFNGPKVLPQEILNGTQRTRSRCSKSSVSYSSQNHNQTTSATGKKVSQRKAHGKVHGGLDVVKLLLGHLEGVGVLNTGNEVLLVPESESNVLKLQSNRRKSKRIIDREIHGEESDVEVVFETVPML